MDKKGRGRTALKGRRQSTLAQRLKDAATCWTKVTIPQWYDQQDKEMLLASGTAVWYHSGMKPVPVRWVLLKDPNGKGEPAVLLCTDLSMEGIDIVSCFIRRWTVEVMLKEVRTQLGVETQRQWSDKAIARSTPALLGLFSITALWADKLLSTDGIALEQMSWYEKRLPAFCDALAALRRQLWNSHDNCTSAPEGQTVEISVQWLNFLTDRLARPA